MRKVADSMLRLRSVIARQEIRAPRFQLRDELLWKLEFDLRIRLTECANETTQAEGRAVLHNFRFRRVSQLLRFEECIFQLAKPINQLVIEGISARKNAAVGNRIAQ